MHAHYRQLAILSVVCLVLSACAARQHTRPASTPISLAGWQSETFPLPPSFAPGLPTGTESLRFAPGWRDPKSENFWSYAFVLWIDEPAPDAARTDQLLEQYYDGLMAAFAEGKPLTPAHVEVTRTAPHIFHARMHLTDAFATFKPIDLRLVIESRQEAPSRSTLRIQISPQPSTHPIWPSLDAAIASILAQDVARPTQPD
ncbi:MAG TPA: hypothetical protein VHN77_09245 [Phycisphaerales bacterium]|nr:hypothetical protein [Phycisphaerales bacterium]